MKVFIFGVGEKYRRFKHLFENMDILGYIDNNPQKWGTELEGHKIFSPSEVLEADFDYIFLTSIYYNDMRKQLLNLGIEADKIIDKEHRGFLKSLNQMEEYIYSDNKKTENQGRNVLLFSHALDLTGAPVVFCRLAKVLKKYGYNVTVVAEKNSKVKHGDLLYQLLQDHISVIMVSNYEFIDIAEIAADYDFFWVSTVLLSNVVACLLKLNKKVYWWLHETDDIYEQSRNSLVFPESANLYVLTGGWMAAESFEKYSGQKAFKNLMYGIPANMVEMKRRNDNNKVKFGVIAAYSIRKGQDILLEVIKKNIDKWFDLAEFYFVGPFPREKSEKYETFMNIYFLGEMNPKKLSEFYEEIDVLIAPSLFDPMPVVVTEAMQHNKVCLVSNKVGQSKYITPMVDGMICNAGNAIDLEKNINWLIENKHKLSEMGKKSYLIYENGFSMESFENNVLDLLGVAVDE